MAKIYCPKCGEPSVKVMAINIPSGYDPRMAKMTCTICGYDFYEMRPAARIDKTTKLPVQGRRSTL